MERIAPLAKILAEANGIEWEHLTGTGAGGQIVEQDILDYLSRVMSGEAEPPSTPVDAPPPDWNGEDSLPDMSQFDTSALSKAGVESDLTDYMQQSRGAAPVTPALHTDDFELEDEPVTEPPVTEPVAQPVQPAASEASAAAGGLGSLLSRLYHKEDSASEAAAPVSPVSAGASAPAPVAPAVAETPASAPAFTMPATTMPASSGTTSPAAPVQPEPVRAEPEPVQPAPVAVPEPVAPAAAVSTPTPVAPAASAAPIVSGPTQTGETPRDAVWFGTYLRRDADVKNLSDLQGQLAEALEREVPLALLVARAAQRHAEALGLHSVAMQDVQAGKALHVGSHSSSLRDALGQTHRDHEGKPDLLVVDAGSLGLDDLHYPETLSLSVGRVQDGRASLSLQGDVDTAKAAQFLNAVAETLAKPVILLV